MVRIRTTRDSYFFLTPPRRVRRGLLLRTVVRLERFGKYLVMALDNEARLILHLGMSGQVLCAGARSPRLLRASARALPDTDTMPFEIDEHTHLQIHFDDHREAVLVRDVRKLGKCALRRPWEAEPRLERLGVDALAVDGKRLFFAMRRRNSAIKSTLLDQKVLAGVGNIYADEALCRAGIRPTRRASQLTRRDCQDLAENIREVLRAAIEAGGSSIDDYVQPDGSEGAFARTLWVYGRTGQPCRRCGQTIRRIVLQQRSAHYCPKCQR
jgi:formamidopyrimidine-DNA glycosylase